MAPHTFKTTSKNNFCSNTVLVLNTNNRYRTTDFFTLSDDFWAWSPSSLISSSASSLLDVLRSSAAQPSMSLLPSSFRNWRNSGSLCASFSSSVFPVSAAAALAHNHSSQGNEWASWITFVSDLSESLGWWATVICWDYYNPPAKSPPRK